MGEHGAVASAVPGPNQFHFIAPPEVTTTEAKSA